MILNPKLCPCNCGKVILEPICGCQCGSVYPEEAHELMVKVNNFDDVLEALERMHANPSLAHQKMAQDILGRVLFQLKSEPRFPR